MGISRDTSHKRRSTGGKMRRIRKKRKFEIGRQPASTKIGEKRITRIRVRGGNYKFRALRLDQGNFSWASEAVTRKTRILRVVYNSTNNELVRTNTLVKGSIIQIDSAPFKAWYLQFYNVELSKKEPKEGAAQEAKKEPKKEGKKEEKKEPKKEGKKEVKKEEKKEPKKGAKKEEKSQGKSGAVKTQGKKGGDKSKGKTTAQKPKELSKSQLDKFSRRSSYRTVHPALLDQFKTGRVYAKISSRPGQSGRCDGYIIEGEELTFYLKKMNLKKKR